jgi:hypothetical protein
MSKFKVGDKVRALANPTEPIYSNDGYFKAGEEFTVKEVFPVQETVSLVERGLCWHESRFELVEPSRLTNFKVGDKVRRKSDSYCLGWDKRDAVCEVIDIYVRRDGTQSLTLKGVSCSGWDGYRFDLVEDVKPAVAPQLPGIPEGYRAVRVGTPKRGEWYINVEGHAERGDGFHSASSYVILEKIDQPAPVEPVKPEAPVAPAKKVAPVFKVGDKIKCIRSFWGCEVGNVYEVLKDTSSGYLIFVDDDGDERLRKWDLHRPEFELVTENPNDLVIQDRVPAREGIDFGWWVSPEKFDTFVPKSDTKWEMSGYYAGKMHGYATDRGRSLMFVTCYRKDLPALPTAEKVVLDEYLVWDTDGPKCIVWSSEDPSVENDVLEHWHHAFPTGNTREVEVPLVKA